MEKEKGSIAVYIEPWHIDIFDFLEYKRPHGDEQSRARDLFYALWVPDLFMEAVQNDDDWALMCPSECPGLNDVYGEEFEILYKSYIKEGRHRKMIKAKDIWNEIIKTQSETGIPYITYKDHVNRKSNHKNIGTIKSSNLCNEIVQYSDLDTHAVCNLASLALPKYIDQDGKYNYNKLMEVTRVIVRNLNNVIDINYYPTPESRTSNMDLRPMGIGVQGLSDVFNILRIPFDSQEAREINKNIFEHIYYAALDESCKLAEKYGHYPKYQGSPVSNGILHMDHWENVSIYN